jgi:hypothetical protein
VPSRVGVQVTETTGVSVGVIVRVGVTLFVGVGVTCKGCGALSLRLPATHGYGSEGECPSSGAVNATAVVPWLPQLSNSNAPVFSPSVEIASR